MDHGSRRCARRAPITFSVGQVRTPPAEVRRLAVLPSRPQPSGWWNWPNVREALIRRRPEAIANLSPYPADYTGRGVVMVGGGKYFASAYVSLGFCGWSAVRCRCSSGTSTEK